MNFQSREYERKLCELIEIRSPTGGEDEAMDCLGEWLEAMGAKVYRWETPIQELLWDAFFPGMEVEREVLPVVVGELRGEAPGPCLALTGHVDVVPTGRGWSIDPFQSVVKDQRVFGRGASDMKGGLISALLAFEKLAERPDFRGTRWFIAVPSEEDGGAGTLAAIRKGWIPDAAIIPEPSTVYPLDPPDLIVAHAGALTFDLEIEGQSAHASNRLEGQSALELFWPFYQAIQHQEVELQAREEHPLLKALPLAYPTNFGMISGGRWSSSVMDELRTSFRVGVALGESIAEARARIHQVVEKVAQKNAWFQSHALHLTQTGGAFHSAAISTNHELVQLCAQKIQEVFGQKPAFKAVPYGCDMGMWIHAAQVPTLVFGPGELSQAHAPDESISIVQGVKVAKALWEIARAFGR